MKKSLLSILLVSLLLCPTFYAQDEEEEKSPSEAPPRKLKPEGGGGVRAKMIERLKAMDLNADGLVSEEEFQGPEKLFSHLDKNGDGSVDLAKELSGMGQGKGGFGKGEFGGGRGEFGGRGNRPGRGEGMGRMQPIDMSALFDKWDTNGDGILNREEFVAQDLGKTLREMHRQSLMDEEGEGEAFSKRARKTPLASDFVPKYDENKDGVITPEELPEIFAGHFEKFDRDGNGSISPEEIEALRKERLEERLREKQRQFGNPPLPRKGKRHPKLTPPEEMEEPPEEMEDPLEETEETEEF